jgi:cell division protein FtsB
MSSGFAPELLSISEPSSVYSVIEQASKIAEQSQLIEKLDRRNMGMGQRIDQLESALKELSNSLADLPGKSE